MVQTMLSTYLIIIKSIIIYVGFLELYTVKVNCAVMSKQSGYKHHSLVSLASYEKLTLREVE